MLRLASLLYGVVAMTLAGVGVIGVLVSGVSAIVPILAAAGAGALLAVPVTYVLASSLAG